jgi:hypothetical protein
MSLDTHLARSFRSGGEVGLASVPPRDGRIARVSAHPPGCRLGLGGHTPVPARDASSQPAVRAPRRAAKQRRGTGLRGVSDGSPAS